MKYILLALLVCFITLNLTHAQDDDDDVTTKKPRRSARKIIYKRHSEEEEDEDASPGIKGRELKVAKKENILNASNTDEFWDWIKKKEKNKSSSPSGKDIILNASNTDDFWNSIKKNKKNKDSNPLWTEIEFWSGIGKKGKVVSRKRIILNASDTNGILLDGKTGDKKSVLNATEYGHDDWSSGVRKRQLKLLKRKDEEDWSLKGPVDLENLSPEFIKKFDPNFTSPHDKTVEKSPRRIQPRKRRCKCSYPTPCLNNRVIRRMTRCLAYTFDDPRLTRAFTRNHLRRYILQKNVAAWFYYLQHCFGISLKPRNTIRIVKCYLRNIPTCYRAESPCKHCRKRNSGYGPLY